MKGLIMKRSWVKILALLLVTLLSMAYSAEEEYLEEDSLKGAYKKHNIMIGVALNRTITMQNPYVEADNADRTMEEIISDTALVKKQFNLIVNENDLKWELIHPLPGSDGYNWEPADAFVQFGVDNDMYTTGHFLIGLQQVPDWVFQADPYATHSEPNYDTESWPPPLLEIKHFFGPVEPLASREQLLERMREHIHAVVGRYKGKIKVWDVVNESLPDNDDSVVEQESYWAQIIGEDYVEKAFEYAHEADPNAILRYSDCSLENPIKRERLKKLVKKLRDAGVPIHAIGTQTHLNLDTSFEVMDETFRDLESIGLPIHITELDVSQSGPAVLNDEAGQKFAKAYENLFRAILKHENSIDMVIFWGVNDDVSWLGRMGVRPLLFDAQNQPKQPAFDTVIKLGAEEAATRSVLNGN